MKVKIIKGTHQIGGCITEITSDDGYKIIIDYGEDLTDDPIKIKKFPIKGLTHGKKEYEGVFITHSHGDHIGLISDIKKNIPIYIEKVSAKVFAVANDFSRCIPINNNLKTFDFEKPIYIHDLKITPYRTDHSAYNSTMFLIENNGKKILHLGDYRSNGYYGENFYENLRKIGNVDLVITEGTNITRVNSHDNKTELELKEEAIQIFKKYKQVFILQASTNLDRLKTFYDAAKETGKKFIVDIATANILKTINDENFQYLQDKDVDVWLSNGYSKENIEFYKKKDADFYDKYIAPFDNVKRSKNSTHGEYVMLVKTSMLKDIKYNLQKYRDNAHLIYSMWLGYRDEKRMNTEKTRYFIKELNKLNIQDEYLHTSGHADIKTINKVLEIIKPKQVIGIHTEDNTLLLLKLPNYVIVNDNESIEV